MRKSVVLLGGYIATQVNLNYLRPMLRLRFRTKIILITLVLSVLLCACSERSNAQSTLTLWADDHSGHDPAWERRAYYFKPSWGIRGSGVSEEGSIWFDSFPGETGLYEIVLGAIIEQDGSSHYEVYANENLLKKGRFGYAKGEKNCDGRGRSGQIALGTHRLEKGCRIRIWGKSVYECGKKGAYTLWYSISFRMVLEE
jgi:hypothetical protein